MNMFKFLFSVALAAIVTFVYVIWARNKSEGQIGKMQLNAYNSPGAETPVPREVMASAMGAVGILWFLQRRILRNSSIPAALALLLGGAAGVAAVIYTSDGSKA
jgi:hypothetical protein